MGYINDKEDAKEAWHSDVEKISNAAWGLYLSLAMFPALVYLLIKYTALPTSAVSYFKLLSLYGYSLFSYVPACVLCVIPNVWVRWIVVMTAFTISTTFLLGNIITGELSETKKKGLPVVCTIILCHAILALLMRF